MSPITHFLIGWGVASITPSLNRRERAMVTLASVIPDFDGLGIVAEVFTQNNWRPLNWYTQYHHTLGHNLGFALLVSATAFSLAKTKWKTTLLTFLSFHLHLIGDVVGARGPDGDQWPIPYLLPLSQQWPWTWSGQWALNAWPNFVITGVLIVLTCVWARKRGYSPLEMFSAKADRAFVAAFRNRFPLDHATHGGLTGCD